MKLLGFDHMIVAVDDTPKAARNFVDLGFDVTHRPDAGVSETDIRIINFDDGSYLELFAFRDPKAPSKHRWKPLMQNGEGWVDYSVHSENADECAAELQKRGVPVSQPRNGSKMLQDGRSWVVRVAEAGFGVGSPTMPFFLQDLAPRELRVPRPASSPVQPGGIGAGIVGVSLVAESFLLVREALTAAFGNPEIKNNRFEGVASTHLFRFFGCWVEVLEIASEPSDMRAYLKRRGDGVYEVAVGRKNRTEPGDGKLLDLNKTHNARLRVA